MVSSIFIREQLEYVQNEVVMQDFPEMLMASGAAIDISTEIPAGAETYSYKLMTFVGEAAILANGADDIPLVNAYAEKRVGVVRTIADSFSYTQEDLEAAAYSQMNLDSTLATAAREVLERKFDNLSYTGDSNFNLLGFINQPNVPTYDIPNDGDSNGGTDSTRFRHKTPDQIYRDLRGFASATRIATNGVESPEIIAMPEEEFDIINGTPYPNGTNTTILSFFLQNQRASGVGVQTVMSMPYLAGKGIGDTDMMISYRKRSNKIKLHMPLDFTPMPVQVRNFTYQVPCRMRVAGVQVLKPLSMRMAYGI